jgi:hypothetical protein
MYRECATYQSTRQLNGSARARRSTFASCCDTQHVTRHDLRSIVVCCVLGVAIAVGTGSDAGFAATHVSVVRTVECQRPVQTGVEVSYLNGISSPAACKVALRLHRYAVTGHVVVNCTAANRPVLKLRSFEGYRLSLKHGFSMSRGRASFAVSGTDFPAPCV